MSVFVLDGAAILLLVFFFVMGARAGLIKAIFSFLSLSFSLLVSFYVSSRFSEVIYSRFIREKVISQLQNSLNKETLQSSIFESLPEIVSNSLAYYGITEENLNNIINSGKDSVVFQIEKFISPIFIHTIKISLELILFFTFLLVFSFIVKKITPLFRFKIIKPIDSSLGGVFGLIRGYFIIVFFMFFVSLIIQITGKSPEAFSYENIKSTYIFKYMYPNSFI